MSYCLSFRNLTSNLNYFFSSNLKRTGLLGLFWVISMLNTMYSQTVTSNKYTKQPLVEEVPFKYQWAIKTNAIDWLLTVPNIAVEYDLTNSVYNRSTLSLGFKGNWQTYQKYKSPILYNLLDGRVEYRYYWRTNKRTLQSGEKLLLKERLFSTKRLNPKFWRAYYLGGYVNANKYSIKLGKQGLQGMSYGIGVSAGFGIPLYSYKNNFIDIEFGGSLGFIMTKYDVFEYDRISDCYPTINEKCKPMHFSPIPVINDLKVSFVFRFSSIKDKYKQVNHKKIEERQERDRIKDSINVARKAEQALKIAIKDSLSNTQKEEKALKKSMKLKQDSLDKINDNKHRDSLETSRKTGKAEQKKKVIKKDSSAKEDSLKAIHKTLKKEKKDKKTKQNIRLKESALQINNLRQGSKLEAVLPERKIIKSLNAILFVSI